MRGALALPLFLLVVAPSAADPPAGLIVERVGPGAAARAGLRAGDVLLGWQGTAAHGSFLTPFELQDVEMEQAPRGDVLLRGERDGEPMVWTLSPGAWDLESEPVVRSPDAPSALRLWLLADEARTRAAPGPTQDLEAALALVAEALVAAATDPGLAATRARLHGLRAELLEAARRGDEATAALEAALAERRLAGSESLAAAAGLEDLGRLAFRREQFELAEEHLSRSLELRSRLAPDSLATASSLHHLGWTAMELGNLTAAEERLQRSLDLARRREPNGLAVAASLRALGVLGMVRGDLAAAEPSLRAALDLSERVDPEGMETAQSLAYHAIAVALRGDLPEAERLHERALAIKERAHASDDALASSLLSLGVVARQRGDFASAEAHYRRALALFEGAGLESAAANTLNNLGNLARSRGDLAGAAGFLERAAAIQERRGPRTLDRATTLGNQGEIARLRGDLAAARDLLGRSLAIKRELSPESLAAAWTLKQLGDLAADEGLLDESQDHHRHALALHEKLSPGSLAVATSLTDLALLALRRGELDAAAEGHGRALGIRRQLAPGSVWEAESSHELGVVARRQGRISQALEHFGQAVAALEEQARRLGGNEETRAAFAARYELYYRHYLELLLEHGRPAEAFHVLERSRASALLDLLARRDLDLGGEIPLDLDRERRAADAEYERVLRRLSRSSSSTDREAATRALAAGRQRQQDARARIRIAAPRSAEWREPRALDLEQVRATLDPGTLLLSYSLGEPTSHLFAVGPEPGELRVHPLEGEASIRRRVRDLDEAIQRVRGRRGRAALLAGSRELGGVLLGPAAEAIRRADRLLVLPGGALHRLPFAALTLPGEERHLVEAKPIHVAVSATVHALLRGEGARTGPERVVAFGAPEHATVAAPLAASRDGGATGGLELPPLPASREEVEALRRLDPAMTAWLGRDATEERAKELDRAASVVHFACHALVDEVAPLESALALSASEGGAEGGEDGLLHAWEVLEELRLDADLVTLSACESGGGKEVGGEGIVGLTWAFQYAGARSVLASLWQVSDPSTARLMEQFYAHVGDGRSRDEALRLAQLDLLGEPATAAPYHWAAFQLVGARR